MCLALGGTAGLLGVLAATIVEFAKVDRTAAALLVPYLGFSSFAAALTYTVWKNNEVDVRLQAYPSDLFICIPCIS